jgi:hypothetical protein
VIRELRRVSTDVCRTLALARAGAARKLVRSLTIWFDHLTGGAVKVLRASIIAAALSLAATAAFALGTRGEASSTAACGNWDYCFCLEIDCYMGDQLCATVADFACYQW